MNRGAVDIAVAGVWNAFGRSEGLISDLAADAAWVRASEGELTTCLPRLLELWADRRLGHEPAAHEVLGLVAQEWPNLSSAQARSVERLGDVLWTRALTTYPSDPAVDELLGQLVWLGLPMVRWLDPWLAALDGAGARHLADVILRPSKSEAWQARPDSRQQLEAWSATESVVIGLTVVGGVHLEEGDFGALLDRLI